MDENGELYFSAENLLRADFVYIFSHLESKIGVFSEVIREVLKIFMDVNSCCYNNETTSTVFFFEDKNNLFTGFLFTFGNLSLMKRSPNCIYNFIPVADSYRDSACMDAS